MNENVRSLLDPMKHSHPSRRFVLKAGLSVAALAALRTTRAASAATPTICTGQDSCGHLIGGIKVKYKNAAPVADVKNHYPGFARTTTVFKAGTSPVLIPGVKNVPGTKLLPVDIQLDKDVAIKLRDGVTIYADIFRPADRVQEKLPAILVWSPYGKEGGWQSFAGYNPGAPGAGIVPPAWCSNLAKFEGPDPAFFCQFGYAIVNVDPRGVNQSEGDIHAWGSQDAEDGYDVIEWIAANKLSTGAVGMCGTSWLAITQWFIASGRPPHLLAINPREAVSDIYRDGDLRGGVQDLFFNELILDHLYGNNQIEDMPTMGRTYGLMNPYWEDKSAKVENIDIPVYLIGSWTNAAHTMGTYTAWRNLKTEKKWLRVHNTQEWYDFYSTAHQLETLRFFDRYLKGAQNGWETTPQVRLSVLDPGGIDLVDVKVSAFPLEQTRYVKLFLDAAKCAEESEGVMPHVPVTVGPHAACSGALAMSLKQPRVSAQTRYLAGKAGGSVSFTFPAHQNTYLVGYFKLRIWLELSGANDADLFVLLQKLDSSGKQIPVVAPGGPTGQTPLGPVPFPNGIMRASHYELDPSRSTAYHPVPNYYKQAFIRPGQIVPVEIPITPMGLRFEKGQQLRIVISGTDFRPVTPPDKEYDSGTHIIHTGGAYDSHVLIPYIPV